ncbi:hypothetical protein RHSIM_Rhsim02G0101600 [Rhododendron simsii]|uniref:Integrase catalytic domain-containing protein n=1 Tax=Rhododendron simsii TaxID=118357 RepID=A0A834HBL3_RHOSS|nr:hypothetical protein RHSIM_Rhsim02G0101600 [Rhododendron simsii]
MVPYLRGQNLMAYVDGSFPCPSSTGDSPSPNQLAWTQQDQLLMSLLISSLSEEVLPIIVGSTTSHEIWDTLEKSLASASQTRMLHLTCCLQSIRQKDRSVTAFLHEAKTLADELSAAGKPLSRAEFNLYIFKGLHSNFKDLVTTLASRPDHVSFSELHSLLLSHEFLHNDTISSLQISSPVESPQAHFTQTGRGRGFHNRGRGRGYHNSSGNRHSPHATGSSSAAGILSLPPNATRIRCQICGRTNHTAAQCYDRFNQRVNSPSAHYTTVDWFPDTGATHHVTPDLSSLSTVDDYRGNSQLQVGNGIGIPISHVGSSILRSPNSSFQLTNVLHVPSFTKSLLSVHQFCKDNNAFFEFHPSHFLVKDQITKKPLLHGKDEGGLYKLSPTGRHVSPPSSPPLALSSECVPLDCWHRRLGHPHARVLHQVLKSQALPFSANKQCTATICHACQLGKSSRLTLSSTGNKSVAPLDLIFSDVWGPSPFLSSDGHKYFVIFLDDFSKYIWYYPLFNKSDVFNIFSKFQAMVERQFSSKIKSVQTDWGGEFRKLNSYFATLGILHRLPCPHTHEQNGSIERRHRHVVETGLALLAHASIPHKYWQFAFETAVYLINRMPSRVSIEVEVKSFVLTEVERDFGPQLDGSVYCGIIAILCEASVIADMGLAQTCGLAARVEGIIEVAWPTRRGVPALTIRPILEIT